MRRMSKATKLLLQQLESLPRPESISKTKWRGVKTLLIAIAHHYPKPYPSQATLADETGYDVRSIRRYQATAIEAGLLLVWADAGRKGEHNSWSKTNRYHITIEDKLSSMSEDRLSSEPYGLRPPGVELRSTHSSECVSQSDSLAALANVQRFDDFGPGETERQVGKQVPPRPEKRRRQPQAEELVIASGVRPRPKRQRRVLPWAAATEHFGRTWQAMIETLPADDRLRSVRAMETRGHCKRYFDATFFGSEATEPKTLDEVCQLIDRFVEDAYRRRAKIKDSQSAWMAFTGGWGRKPGSRQYHNTVPDYTPPPLED